MRGAQTHGAFPPHAPRPHADEPGLEVSLSDLFEDGQIERLVGDDPFEPQILLLQGCEALRLIHAQPSILFLPAVVGVFGDPELPTGLEHGQPLAGVELNRPQMLNNLFGRVPFLGHDPDLPWLRSSLPFNLDQICPGRSLMRDIIVDLAVGASLSLTVTGCSVAMALSGNPEPNFKAFEIGSTRQVVETQLGHPVASQKLEDGKQKDTYQYEMGNSPNGHRALMNLY